MVGGAGVDVFCDGMGGVKYSVFGAVDNKGGNVGEFGDGKETKFIETDDGGQGFLLTEGG